MKREIRIDPLGIGHLLKGIQYLLFPAAIGVDLLRGLVEAAAKAEARDIEMEARERTSKSKEKKE